MSGHIFDMVNRIAQNKISLRKKFKGDNRAMMYCQKLETVTEYTFPTVSEAEMKLLKTQIAKTTKTSFRKSLYIFLIVIVIIAFAFWAFLKYYTIDPYTIAS